LEGKSTLGRGQNQVAKGKVPSPGPRERWIHFRDNPSGKRGRVGGSRKKLREWTPFAKRSVPGEPMKSWQARRGGKAVKGKTKISGGKKTAI